ncbi:hypothetical protein DKG74_06000 [Zavarzinia aquatilis]|uniref:Uncharacterized protein n=1 Tax=Zavarzinia aquatilis TaxID=2211142 RepID=A0A317EEX6_9PROT|nr:hypothetical protein DKG74_06000 [Zavarzinia aquatilis]
MEERIMAVLNEQQAGISPTDCTIGAETPPRSSVATGTTPPTLARRIHLGQMTSEAAQMDRVNVHH